MIDPSTLVCPHCGTPAAEHRFCAQCGLELVRERELPTRARWEEGVFTPTPSRAEGEPTPATVPANSLVCPRCGTPAVEHRFCGQCGLELFREPELPTRERWEIMGGAYGAMSPEARPRDGYVERLRKEFQQAPVAVLVPLGTWLEEKPWNVTWARWFVVFAIAPFVLLQAAANLDLQNVAWAFGLYFAAMWLIVLTLVIRPKGVPAGTFVKIALFTAFIGTVLAVFLERLLASAFFSDSDAPGGLLSNLAGVAVPEELVKLVPVYLLLYRGTAHVGPLTMAYAGAVSGLAFGAAEAVAYSADYTSAADAGYLQGDDLVVAQVWRLVGGPLFHACLTGITAYFLGVAKHRHSVAHAVIITGLALSIVLHGS